MDSDFTFGKNLLVGKDIAQSTSLKRDLLLYDGFVDESSGKDYPDIYKAVLEQFKSNLGSDFLNNKVQYPIFSTMKACSELSSLGLVRSFSDLNLDEQHLNLESAFSLINSVSDELNFSNNIDFKKYNVFPRENDVIENEMIYAASQKLRHMDANATPRFHCISQPITDYRSTVAKIVLDKFPFPGPDTSFSQILDFKNDFDSIRKLGSLNVLIGRLAREKANPADILQEIEQLLIEAKSVMKARKIAYRESKITKACRVAESVIKGNLGDLFKIRDQEKAELDAKSELKLSVEELALMETEVASEWKHVAYILKANSLVQS